MNKRISALYPKIYVRFFVIYVIIISSAIILMSCKAKTVQSQWNQADIVIDGKTGEWQSLQTSFDEDLNIMYSIINNDQHLNILIHFQEKFLARKILTQGFTIWLDKKKTKGICYIDYIAQTRFIDNLLERRDHVPGERMRSPKDEKVNWVSGNFYLIEGDLEKRLTGNSCQGIQAAAGEENNDFCLEYEIKFSNSEGDDVNLNLNGKNKFKTALEISGLPEGVKKNLKRQFSKGPGGDGDMSRGPGESPPGGGNMPGNGPPGGGGMPGGGRPGRGGPPGGGSFDPFKQFEEQILWLNVILAGNE